ncbi:AMP-binding protein [Pseudonocardia nigra]|uniref:AMP-binding protein n=1 Tax=Pseudonocardia nigra TaxID=1921578 RepID=UPI0027E33743|nr:AMP-binding protein [Pseudonocardia nigra]
MAPDGEILVRGEQVSPGYWPLRDGTGADPLHTGWLHTGDLGELDADGFLAITGRRKEIIVTSGWKNVAPEPLEDRIRLHAGIAAAVVVGEERSQASSACSGSSWAPSARRTSARRWRDDRASDRPAARHLPEARAVHPLRSRVPARPLPALRPAP